MSIKKSFGLQRAKDFLHVFGGALGGVDPSIMGVGPIESTKRLLARPVDECLESDSNCLSNGCSYHLGVSKDIPACYL